MSDDDQDNVVYKYRVYCTIENVSVEIWSDSEPIVCPNNNTHAIDITKTSIIDEVQEKEVRIKEETTKTGGSYKCDIKKISAPGPAGTVTKTIFTWPMPMSILSVTFVSKDEHKDDELEGIGADQVTVGVITEGISIGDTVIKVSDTAFKVLKLGYFVNLDDGANNNDLGRVTAKNIITNEITCEKAATNAFNATSLVKMTVKMAEMILGHPWEYVIGDTKIGGSYVPANSPMIIKYKNNGLTTKELYLEIEYLY